MSLHALTQRIRDFITLPRRQDGLLRDRAAWLQLMTALDLIEDTELAIDAYRGGDAGSSGDLDLQIFGVLQAVFVQQDAITHLAEAFDVDLEGHPRLKEIRDVRNDVAGHPTSRRKGESFHALVRIEMRRNAAKVASWYRDGRIETRSIDLFELLDDQRDLACGLLDEIVDELERREEDYKAIHRDRKLGALFPRDLDYGIEKIAAVTGFDEGRQPLGGIDGILALGGLDAFRNAIASSTRSSNAGTSRAGRTTSSTTT